MGEKRQLFFTEECQVMQKECGIESPLEPHYPQVRSTNKY